MQFSWSLKVVSTLTQSDTTRSEDSHSIYNDLQGGNGGNRRSFARSEPDL